MLRFVFDFTCALTMSTEAKLQSVDRKFSHGDT